MLTYNYSQFRKIAISDTTLRDGEQQPGLCFSTKQKIKILDALIDIGVDDIEIGCAAMYNDEQKFFDYAAKKYIDKRLSLWCRLNPHDLDMSIRSGIKNAHISIPCSDIQMEATSFCRSKVIDTLYTMFQTAQDNDINVSLGFIDATRSNVDFILIMTEIANSLNIKKIRFSDTVGIAMPSYISGLSNILVTHFNGMVEFHGHNDLGLATANCISAAQGGVHSISVTVNGLGERAGNASLEQVVAALYIGLELDTGIKIEKINNLCKLVEKESKIKIPDKNPITGKAINKHESGIHCNGIVKNMETYQFYKPETFGNKNIELVLGKHSGSSTVIHILESHGIKITRSKARELLPSLKKIASKNKGEVSHQQLIDLVQSTPT
ncbi:MAG: homoaconitate hydratase [Deltaproteobacteria bacterium]|nr:homoaconitate hydratase [Deltaproteobacteria bacterium]